MKQPMSPNQRGVVCGRGRFLLGTREGRIVAFFLVMIALYSLARPWDEGGAP